jgi:hypothetical protein
MNPGVNFRLGSNITSLYTGYGLGPYLIWESKRRESYSWIIGSTAHYFLDLQYLVSSSVSDRKSMSHKQNQHKNKPKVKYARFVYFRCDVINSPPFWQAKRGCAWGFWRIWAHFRQVCECITKLAAIHAIMCVRTLFVLQEIREFLMHKAIIRQMKSLVSLLDAVLAFIKIPNLVSKCEQVLVVCLASRDFVVVLFCL